MSNPRLHQVGAQMASLVDAFIPGDADFPSAASIGTQGLVVQRVNEQLGSAGLDRLTATLVTVFPEAADPRFALFELERLDEELFVFLRFATYLSYYQLPPVISALQALGHDYHDSPQPLGYTLPPFDAAAHLPRQPRGTYKATDAIARLDISALDELGLPKAGGAR
jgi:hypothetical protein